MTLLRGIADDLPLMDWLQGYIWPAENRWVNADFVRDGTELAIAEMLRGGVTCFNDMYFFPDAAAQVVRQCGIRASLGLIVLDFPTAWGSSPQEYLDKGLALREQYKSDPLLSFVFAPHAPYTVSDPWLNKVRILADELDMPVHIHLHETADEVRMSLQKSGKRPIARLMELGLFTPALLAVHMTQLTEQEIADSARCGIHIVHCPESNLKLASGFCPVAKLLAAGINVALGTDGAASNNDLNMFGEMRSAALLAKGIAGDAAAVPAETALRIATLNGARALGLDKEAGSLVPGKWADVTAVNLGYLETQPVHNPLSALVYSAGRRQVSDVWVAGKRLLQDGELTRIDIPSLAARVDIWQQRIQGDRDVARLARDA
jgi:5-methylthioadenosine/S-adenosylhomocysteine deaminase